MYLHQYFLIATVALLPTYLMRFTVLDIPTNLLEVLVITCSILTLLEVRFTPLKEFKRLIVPISLIGLFLLAAFLSVIISLHLETSLGILKGWIIIPLLLGGCVFLNAADKKVRAYLIQALILSGTVMALLGIAQLGTVDRVSGIYDVPNSLALYLAPIIILAVWSKSRWNIYFAVLMGVALLATQSVSGMLAVLGALIIGFFWGSFSVNKGWYVICLGALLLVSIGYLSYTGRVTYLVSPFVETGVTNSLSVRQQLWSVSLDIIQESPLLGVGLGVFEPNYQRHLHQRFQLYENTEDTKKPIPEFVFRDPHNWILSFWLNTGLLGLLSFSGVNGWVLYQSFIRRKKLDRQTISLVLSLVTVLLFGLADTIFWKNDLASLYWIILMLIILCLRRR